MTNKIFDEIYLEFPNRGKRKIFIYIPPHKIDSEIAVIYMTDGQNLFDENSTPFGSWQVINAIEREFQNSNKSVAIVGIDNGNIYRDSELTPKSIGKVQHKEELNEFFKPEGEIFDEFLMNIVIPYVENNYPVSKSKENIAICGSSSGGLQAFFEGIEHSEKFGFVGALSPAFLLYNQSDWKNYLLNKITSNMPYIYMYSGGADDLEQRIFDGVEMMYDLLPEVGYPYDMFNEVLLFENEHNEIAWREIFKDFLHLFLNKNFL